MGENIFQKLTAKYPFITLCVHAGTEYVGIIQNRDDTITTIYDFGNIQNPELKRLFIDLANTWWWESNRSIPINIFLKQEWDKVPDALYLYRNPGSNVEAGLARRRKAEGESWKKG